MSPSPAVRTGPVEDRARRDLAAWALGVALALSFAVAEPWASLPQALSALAVLGAGPRVERMRWGLGARLALLGAAIAYAALLPGAPPVVLARFLAALVTISLLRPKGTREHGFVLVLLLLEVAVAAVFSYQWVAAPAGVLLVALGHRAVGSWHVRRAAARASLTGGPLALLGPDASRRAAADAATLGVLVLAVPLFLVLPRASVPFLALPALAGVSEPGVSEEVRLGRLGPLADADEIVGRVAPQDARARGAAPYFRAVVLEDFDGTRWSRRRDGDAPWFDYDAVRGVGEVRGRLVVPSSPRWLFVVDAAAAPRLLLPPRAARLTFREPLPEAITIDGAATLEARARRGVTRWIYEAEAEPAGARALGPYDLEAERRDPNLPPSLRDELPRAVDAALSGMESASPRARAERLEAWIRSTCAYSRAEGPGGANPVGDFLFRVRRGHCEHFAAALALALRHAGLPARLVGGYHGSRWNEVGGFWVLRRRDAHAWVEAWVGPEEGWARFDATPSAAREDDPYAGVGGYLARLRDAAAFLWSRNVLGYDREAQVAGFAAVTQGMRTAWAWLSRTPGWVTGGPMVLLGLGAWWALRRRRPGGAPRTPRPDPREAYYAQTLRLLERHGLARRPGETPDELARRAGVRLGGDGAAALEALTSAFVGTRYGGAPPPPPEVPPRWLERLALAVGSLRRGLDWTGGGGEPTVRGSPSSRSPWRRTTAS